MDINQNKLIDIISDTSLANSPAAALDQSRIDQSFEQSSPNVTIEILIPKKSLGSIVGKGGENIRTLEGQLNVNLKLIQRSTEATGPKPLKITGSAEKVSYARQFIIENYCHRPSLGHTRNASIEHPQNESNWHARNESHWHARNSSIRHAQNAPFEHTQPKRPRLWEEQERSGPSNSNGTHQVITPVPVPEQHFSLVVSCLDEMHNNILAQWIDYYRSLGMNANADVLLQMKDVK